MSRTNYERKPPGEIQPTATGPGHGWLPLSAQELEQRRLNQLTDSRIQRLVQVREQAKQLSQAQVKRYRQQVDQLTEERLGDMQKRWQRQKDAQLRDIREECQKSMSKVGAGHGVAKDVLQEKLERNRLHMEAMVARNQAALQRHSQALSEEEAKRTEQTAPFKAMLERKEHVKQTEMHRALSMVAQFNQEMKERTAQRLEAERTERAAVTRGLPSTFDYRYSRLHEVGVPVLIERHQEAGADGRGKDMTDAVEQERIRAWEYEQKRSAERVEAQDREDKRAALASLKIQMETNKRAVEAELERIQKENQKAAVAGAANGTIKTRLLKDMESRGQQERAEKFFEQRVLQDMEAEFVQRSAETIQLDSAAEEVAEERAETGWPSDPTWVPPADDKPPAETSPAPQRLPGSKAKGSPQPSTAQSFNGGPLVSAAADLHAHHAEAVAGSAPEAVTKDKSEAQTAGLAGRDLTMSDVMAAAGEATLHPAPRVSAPQAPTAWGHVESHRSRMDMSVAGALETSEERSVHVERAEIRQGSAGRDRPAPVPKPHAPIRRKEVSPAPRQRVPKPTARKQTTPPTPSSTQAASPPSEAPREASVSKAPTPARKKALTTKKPATKPPSKAAAGRRPATAANGPRARASPAAEPLPRARKPRPPGASQVPRASKLPITLRPSASTSPYISAAVSPGRRAVHSGAAQRPRPSPPRPRASPPRPRPGTAGPEQPAPFSATNRRETSKTLPIRARHSPVKKVAVARPGVSSVSSFGGSNPHGWSLPTSERNDMGSIAELQAIQRELGLPVTLFGSEKDSASLSTSSSEISGLTEMLRTHRAGVQAAVDRALQRVAAASSASKTHTDISRPEHNAIQEVDGSDGAAISFSLRDQTASQPSLPDTGPSTSAGAPGNDTGDGFSLATDDIHRLQMDLQTSLYRAAGSGSVGVPGLLLTQASAHGADVSVSSSSLEHYSGSTEGLSADGTEFLSQASSRLTEVPGPTTGSVSGVTGASTHRSALSASSGRGLSSVVPYGGTIHPIPSSSTAINMDISMSTVTDTFADRDAASPASSGFTGISSLVPEDDDYASLRPSVSSRAPSSTTAGPVDTASTPFPRTQHGVDSPTSSGFTGLSSIVAGHTEQPDGPRPPHVAAPAVAARQELASPANSIASSALTGVTAMLRPHLPEQPASAPAARVEVSVSSAAVSPTPEVLAQLSDAITRAARDTGLYPGAGSAAPSAGTVEANTAPVPALIAARKTQDFDSVIDNEAREDTEWLMAPDRQAMGSFGDLKTLEGIPSPPDSARSAPEVSQEDAARAGAAEGPTGGTAWPRQSDDHSTASLAARLAAEQARHMLQVWTNDITDDSIAAASPVSAAAMDSLSPIPSSPRSPLCGSSLPHGEADAEPSSRTAAGTAYDTTYHAVSMTSIVLDSTGTAMEATAGTLRDNAQFIETAAATRALTDQVLGEEGAGFGYPSNEMTVGFVSVSQLQEASRAHISAGQTDALPAATLSESDAWAASFSFGGGRAADETAETLEGSVMADSSAASHMHASPQRKRSREDHRADPHFEALPARGGHLIDEDGMSSMDSSLFSTPTETPIKLLESHIGWGSPSSAASGSTAGRASMLQGEAPQASVSGRAALLGESQPGSAGPVMQKTKSDVARRYAHKIAELEARSAEASARQQAARDAAHKATAGVEKLARSPVQSPSVAPDS